MNPAEIGGFVGIAVQAYVQGPQPSETKLVMIQSSEKYDTDSGAVIA